jgi:SAM-dependent methyltransferase
MTGQMRLENKPLPNESSPAQVACIACEHSTKKKGEVPFSYHFLNVELLEPLDTGDLYECLRCGLWFKYPFLSEEVVAQYYESSPATFAWGSGGVRHDFEIVSAFLQRQFPSGAEILDFGCYRGRFLSELPGAFGKKGIEPSQEAAEGARQAGIEIIGKDLSALKGTDFQFDAVTLFDVFEHLTDPLGTLDMLFERVRPGGALCVVTGRADFWLFRSVGPLFYYACMPEHVCFLTHKFGRYLAARYGAGYSYDPIKRVEWDIHKALRAAAIDAVNAPMLFLRSKRAIYNAFFSRRLRIASSRGLYSPGLSDDHAVLILQKPISSEQTSSGQRRTISERLDDN